MGTKNFNVIDKIIAFWRLNQIIKYVDSNDTILDFGCGFQAFFLRSVEKKVKKAVGVDYDVTPGVFGKKLLLKNIRFSKKLPFADKSFDKVFLLAVIEHIDLNKRKLLISEISRVLKPHGKAIFTTPTPASKPLLEFLGRLHIISLAEILDHKMYYSKKNLKSITVQKKLQLVEYRYFQFGLNSLAVFQKQ